METFDVVIIGAGAAGLMCAIEAGRRGRRVLLLDHAEKPGAKILISGGGRCNFTNLEADRPERYLSANPHFCKSALSRYTPRDFIAMVERHRIAYHEKTLGQLFCDGSAREILAMLLDGVPRGACRLARRPSHHGYRAHRSLSYRDQSRQRSMRARLVIATGGLSIPKIGATGFAYEVARRFGLAIIEPRPGLVGLRVEGETLALCHSLTGVSVDAIVSCGRVTFRENILFTHRGLSGPAILQISSYWKNGEALSIDLVPTIDAESFLRDRRRTRPRGRAEDDPRGNPSEPPRRSYRHARGSDGESFRPPSRRDGGAAEALAGAAHRFGRMGEGRGDGRRHRYCGAIFQNNGSACGSRPLHHRRGGRTSRDGWAATISNGRGRADGALARRFSILRGVSFPIQVLVSHFRSRR